MNETLINVENLCAERDGRVLFSGLDFSVATGQVVQVTGANGAGKTTLLRMLCGLLPATAGEIYWRGKPAATVCACVGQTRMRESGAVNRLSAFDLDAMDVKAVNLALGNMMGAIDLNAVNLAPWCLLAVHEPHRAQFV